MVRTRTLVNAGIGAVVAVVLSFIPFSTVLGGLVAGFLEGPDGREGAIVGALAGAITFLPIAGMGLVLFGILGFGLTGGVPLEGFALVSLMIVVVGSFALLYTVGLSLLGGYLGAYLAREYPARHRQTTETLGYEPEPTGPTADSTPLRDREPNRDSEPMSDPDRVDSSGRGTDRYPGRREEDRDANREREHDDF